MQRLPHRIPRLPCLLPATLASCSLPQRYATRRSTQYGWLIKKYVAVWWRSPNYSECNALGTMRVHT